MANHHFAKLGDVWKHLPLAEALRLEPPASYCETHCGSAWYPLTPSAERRYGVYEFLARAPAHAALRGSRYRGLLRELPGAGGIPERYPGSGALAMLELGARADYVLADTDPATVDDMQRAAAELGVGGRALCVVGDGIAAVRDHCARFEGDPATVLVHVDPFDPFDDRGATGLSPVGLAAWLAERSFRVAYWYGLDEEGERGWAWRRLRGAAPGWCGELVFPARFVYPDREGLWGCGMVFLNFAPRTHAALARLGRELAVAYRDLPRPGEPGVEFAEHTGRERLST